MGYPVVPEYPAAPPYAPPAAEHELQALKAQAQHLEQTLVDIGSRIAELEQNQEQQD